MKRSQGASEGLSDIFWCQHVNDLHVGHQSIRQLDGIDSVKQELFPCVYEVIEGCSEELFIHDMESLVFDPRQ